MKRLLWFTWLFFLLPGCVPFEAGFSTNQKGYLRRQPERPDRNIHIYVHPLTLTTNAPTPTPTP